MTPSYIRYRPVQPRPDGYAFVTRVTNLGDPRCPHVAFDLATRMQTKEPVVQIFILNAAEYQAMTATRH